MFEYFPNNYTWSLGVMGAINRGGQISEIDEACRPLKEYAGIKALETPLLKKVLADSGVRAIGSTPEEFARFLEDDMRWQIDIIKRIGLQPQ